MSSLQDQLLKAGLVDQKKAKKVQKDKRKAAKVQRKTKDVPVDEVKQQAQEAKAAKVQRDRELNKQLQADAELKALAAQIKQLIQGHRQPKGDAETPYNFNDGKTIKKIFVSEAVSGKLARGQLAIARLEDDYELIPAVVAEKICERDASYIVLLHQRQASGDEDEEDPYADYQIPDDLMW